MDAAHFLRRTGGLPRALAIDLDGTLLRSDGKLSPRTLSVLNHCRAVGVLIVLATARPPRSVALLVPADLHDVPWICYNGAEVYDRGERIYQRSISPPIGHHVLWILGELASQATISVEVDAVRRLPRFGAVKPVC